MRILTLHQECSILRGMMDTKIIPKDIIYPVTLKTSNATDLTVESDSGTWFFNLSDKSL